MTRQFAKPYIDMRKDAAIWLKISVTPLFTLQFSFSSKCTSEIIKANIQKGVTKSLCRIVKAKDSQNCMIKKKST